MGRLSPQDVMRMRLKSIREKQEELDKAIEKMLGAQDQDTQDAFKQLAIKKSFELYGEVVNL